MIVTVNKKKATSTPAQSTAPVPESEAVVTTTTKKSSSILPTDPQCNGTTSIIHLVATTTALVGTSLIVGNIVHRLRPGSWIMPAVVGAISGSLASRIVGTTVNRWRGSHC